MTRDYAWDKRWPIVAGQSSGFRRGLQVSHATRLDQLDEHEHGDYP